MSMEITQQYLTPHYLEDPDDVLAYLAAPIRAIHAALDHGISLADAKMSDIEPDASLWAHHVRHAARCHLAAQQQDGWELSRKKLPNSGIQVVCMPLLVRVLKSQNGGPPNPGHSKARQNYFSQQTLANPGMPLVFGNVVMPPGPNFVLDWGTNERRQIDIALSKPRECWNFQNAQKLVWRRPIAMRDDEGLEFSPGEDFDITIESIIDPIELEASGGQQ